MNVEKPLAPLTGEVQDHAPRPDFELVASSNDTGGADADYSVLRYVSWRDNLWLRAQPR